jgi:hypothetical protein
LIEEIENRESEIDVVTEVIETFKREKKFIVSSSKIAKICSLILGNKVKIKRVSQIMKEECQLSYKRNFTYKVDINLESHKLKRHYFGKFLLERMHQGYRVINFDESAVDQFDFQYYSWSQKGMKNAYCSKVVSPRITLVAAIDNLGNKYMSMLQCNSNRHTTILVLSQLFELLYEDDPYWNESSIIIIDGAKYHTT